MYAEGENRGGRVKIAKYSYKQVSGSGRTWGNREGGRKGRLGL